MLPNDVLEHNLQATLRVGGRKSRPKHYRNQRNQFLDSPHRSADVTMIMYKNPSFQEFYLLQITRHFKKLRMFSHLIFLASSALSVLTSPSTALPSPLNLDSNSLLHQQAGLDTRTTNTTSLQDLASPVVSYTPECGIAYGRNLNHTSCEDALSKITQVTTPMTFGERGTGSWDVVLPRRYLSGTSVYS